MAKVPDQSTHATRAAVDAVVSLERFRMCACDFANGFLSLLPFFAVSPRSRSESASSSDDLYKTELCHVFETTGSCKYGLRCRFAHGRSEMRPVARHPKYKTQRCKTFKEMGHCPYGPRCKFVHEEERVIVEGVPTTMLELISSPRMRLNAAHTYDPGPPLSSSGNASSESVSSPRYDSMLEQNQYDDFSPRAQVSPLPKEGLSASVTKSLTFRLPVRDRRWMSNNTARVTNSGERGGNGNSGNRERDRNQRVNRRASGSEVGARRKDEEHNSRSEELNTQLVNKQDPGEPFGIMQGRREKHSWENTDQETPHELTRRVTDGEIEIGRGSIRRISEGELQIGMVPRRNESRLPIFQNIASNESEEK